MEKQATSVTDSTSSSSSAGGPDHQPDTITATNYSNDRANGGDHCGSDDDDDSEDDDGVKVERPSSHSAYANDARMDVHEEFMNAFRPWHLLDPRRPWVLVPHGSFGGHFDWVPVEFRVGPWSVPAVCYWTAIWYAVLLTGCYYYYYYATTTATQTTTAATEPLLHDYSAEALLQQYPAAFSVKWWYHCAGCQWMVFIMYLLLAQSPLGYRAWSTFTVLSWTLLAVRHGLCAALPWCPSLLTAVEWMRFPCALCHTVVFAVWNFVLVPFLLRVVMRDDEEKRRNFVKFILSFRLFNLHVVNIALCVLHTYWASPPRQLVYADLYAACVGVVLYMTFYLYGLDRLGVHLYPIFSPRKGKMVLASWTGSIVLYLATFYGWRRLLRPDESPEL